MVTDKRYKKAWDSGYRQGLYAATKGSKADLIIRNDLLHVYGNMALALHKRGWKRETIEGLIFSIQQMWQAEMDETGRRYDAGLPIEKIEQKVERITGVHLEQMAETISSDDDELGEKFVNGNYGNT